MVVESGKRNRIGYRKADDSRWACKKHSWSPCAAGLRHSLAFALGARAQSQHESATLLYSHNLRGGLTALDRDIATGLETFGCNVLRPAFLILSDT
jgi:hypothetical protein